MPPKLTDEQPDTAATEPEVAALAQKRIAAEWAAMKIKEITTNMFAEANELRAKGSIKLAEEKRREAQMMLDNQAVPEYSAAVETEKRLRGEFERAQDTAFSNYRRLLERWRDDTGEAERGLSGMRRPSRFRSDPEPAPQSREFDIAVPGKRAITLPD